MNAQHGVIVEADVTRPVLSSVVTTARRIHTFSLCRSRGGAVTPVDGRVTTRSSRSRRSYAARHTGLTAPVPASTLPFRIISFFDSGPGTRSSSRLDQSLPWTASGCSARHDRRAGRHADAGSLVNCHDRSTHPHLLALQTAGRRRHTCGRPGDDTIERLSAFVRRPPHRSDRARACADAALPDHFIFRFRTHHSMFERRQRIRKCPARRDRRGRRDPSSLVEVRR